MTSGKKDTTSDIRAELDYLSDFITELQVSMTTSLAQVSESNKATINMGAEMLQAMVTLSERFKENNASLAKLITAMESIIKRVDTLEKTNALLYYKNKALS